jgi:hypothetical protein
MKYFFLLLPWIVWTVPGAETNLAWRWLSTDHTPAERDRLVERSKQASFVELAPTLLKVLVEYRPMLLRYNHVGDTPWNHRQLTSRDRNFVMAEVVWSHHLGDRDNPAKAAALLNLLPPGDTNPHGRYLVVHAMTHDQWIPEMEPVLARMLSDASRSNDAKRAALAALLHRADLNRYVPAAIRFVKAAEDVTHQLREYNRLTNHGNRLPTLSEVNRRALLETGFELLKQVPEAKIDQGYFVALQLGVILKIRNRFKPDQKAEKYQSPTGLTGAFFRDTVRNALAWHAENWQ